jgi:hypothetical protein
MFVKKTIYSLLLLLLSLFFLECKKAPNYPKEPSIQFDHLRVINDTIHFVDSVSIYIKFQDGEGDIGNDPVDKNYFDFFLDIYKKTNGAYLKITNFDSLGLDYNAHLPLLAPYNQKGPIDGTIRNILAPFEEYLDKNGKVRPAPINAPFHKDDTLQFHVRIRDRAGNYSNWIESTDYIVWDKF